MLTDITRNLEIFSIKKNDLSIIASIFAKYLKKKDLILLSGKVGSGKTEFSRLIIKAKAKKEKLYIEEVSSPTFSLIQTYEFRDSNVSHIDLYRIESEAELFELGMPDLFDTQITLVEWPEILETKNYVRYVKFNIRENKKFEDHRDIEIKFVGRGWDDLLASLLKSEYFKSGNI
jgi:tRNA threonylcarbamoyl adenosine modification protein YjeE